MGGRYELLEKSMAAGDGLAWANVDTALRSTVPRRLAYAMAARGATSRSLAAEAGVSTSVISRVLAGKRPITTEALVRICVALDVDPTWLLGLSPWHVLPPERPYMRDGSI